MTQNSDIDRTIKLCDITDLADGDIAKIEIDGVPIAYARVGEQWFAIDDTCSHAKVSLAEGIVDEDDLTIECPKHGALFSLETGAALTLPAIKPVASYAVHVDGTEVLVTLANTDNNNDQDAP